MAGESNSDGVIEKWTKNQQHQKTKHGSNFIVNWKWFSVFYSISLRWMLMSTPTNQWINDMSDGIDTVCTCVINVWLWIFPMFHPSRSNKEDNVLFEQILYDKHWLAVASYTIHDYPSATCLFFENNCGAAVAAANGRVCWGAERARLSQTLASKFNFMIFLFKQQPYKGRRWRR